MDFNIISTFQSVYTKQTNSCSIHEMNRDEPLTLCNIRSYSTTSMLLFPDDWIISMKIISLTMKDYLEILFKCWNASSETNLDPIPYNYVIIWKDYFIREFFHPLGEMKVTLFCYVFKFWLMRLPIYDEFWKK